MSTTINYVGVDAISVEIDAYTNEEKYGVQDKAVYEDLTDLEGAMFETSRQVTLRTMAAIEPKCMGTRLLMPNKWIGLYADFTKA